MQKGVRVRARRERVEYYGGDCSLAGIMMMCFYLPVLFINFFCTMDRLMDMMYQWVMN